MALYEASLLLKPDQKGIIWEIMELSISMMRYRRDMAAQLYARAFECYAYIINHTGSDEDLTPDLGRGFMHGFSYAELSGYRDKKNIPDAVKDKNNEYQHRKFKLLYGLLSRQASQGHVNWDVFCSLDKIYAEDETLRERYGKVLQIMQDMQYSRDARRYLLSKSRSQWHTLGGISMTGNAELSWYPEFATAEVDNRETAVFYLRSFLEELANFESRDAQMVAEEMCQQYFETKAPRVIPKVYMPSIPYARPRNAQVVKLIDMGNKLTFEGPDNKLFFNKPRLEGWASFHNGVELAWNTESIFAMKEKNKLRLLYGYGCKGFNGQEKLQGVCSDGKYVLAVTLADDIVLKVVKLENYEVSSCSLGQAIELPGIKGIKPVVFKRLHPLSDLFCDNRYLILPVYGQKPFLRVIDLQNGRTWRFDEKDGLPPMDRATVKVIAPGVFFVNGRIAKYGVGRTWTAKLTVADDGIKTVDIAAEDHGNYDPVKPAIERRLNDNEQIIDISGYKNTIGDPDYWLSHSVNGKCFINKGSLSEPDNAERIEYDMDKELGGDYTTRRLFIVKDKLYVLGRRIFLEFSTFKGEEARLFRVANNGCIPGGVMAFSDSYGLLAIPSDGGYPISICEDASSDVESAGETDKRLSILREKLRDISYDETMMSYIKDVQDISSQCMGLFLTELKNDDAKIRANCARGLGLLGIDVAKAIPDLIGALADSDVNVCYAASRALARIGEVAIPALIAALGVRPSNHWRQQMAG
ncbi:MAG: HEAT repeat domain-containing protein [bacterium]|nr:HEAT repeat domain-containing protein [bacterium]